MMSGGTHKQPQHTTYAGPATRSRVEAAQEVQNRATGHVVTYLSQAAPVNSETHGELMKIKKVCKCLKDAVGTELTSAQWSSLQAARRYIHSVMKPILYTNGTRLNLSLAYHGRRGCITANEFSSVSRALWNSRGHVEVVNDMFAILWEFLPKLGMLNEYSQGRLDQIRIFCQNEELYNAVRGAMESALQAIELRVALDPLFEVEKSGELCQSTSMFRFGMRIMHLIHSYRRYCDPPPPDRSNENTTFFITRGMFVFNKIKRTEAMDEFMLQLLMFARVNNPLRSLDNTLFFFNADLLTSSIHDDTPNILEVLAGMIRHRAPGSIIVASPAQTHAFRVIETYVSANPRIGVPDPAEPHPPNGFRNMLRGADSDTRIVQTVGSMVTALCHIMKICINNSDYRRATGKYFELALQLLAQMTTDIRVIRGSETTAYAHQIVQTIFEATGQGLEPGFEPNGLCTVIDSSLKYMRSLVKHSHAAGAADAAYAAPIGIQTLTPAPTQLLIIRTVINCMQKQNTRTKDMQLGIEILLDLYDAASDATRRKMAEYSIVCYKRINWQYESLLRMIFRRVGSVFNQTAHTFLLTMIELVTSHSANIHILYEPPNNTPPTSAHTEPILYELCSILHIHSEKLVLSPNPVFVPGRTRVSHPTLYIPTMRIFEAVAGVFARDECDVSHQRMASARIDFYNIIDATNSIHHEMITPIGVMHDILCLEIPKHVAMHCCMFLWNVMKVHPGGQENQRENCATISPECIHDALEQIRLWGINTEQICEETFQAMLPHVTGT